MASPMLATILDELLEEIFLRLPTPATVAYASATCTSFRRVIKGRAFRRRFCSLHLPPLLGFMDAAGFHPAEVPHPSAPLAGALAPCAADYSFVRPSFLLLPTNPSSSTRTQSPAGAPAMSAMAASSSIGSPSTLASSTCGASPKTAPTEASS
ncbi:hypothetical protein ACQ4PT_047544 [Festuca glaucescens]